MRRAVLIPDAGRQTLTPDAVTAAKAAFASRPGVARAGNLFLPTNGYSAQRDTGSAWESWGPVYPLTKPPVAADFTWTNQGGATATDSADALILAAPSNSGDSWRILRKAAPATPYTIKLAIIPSLIGADFVHAGFIWRQSSDGKFIAVDLVHDAGWKLRVAKWTDESTFSANYVSLTAPIGNLIWLQCQDDGTTRSVVYSADGQNGASIHSVGRTDFLTANQVGIGLNVNNASYYAAMNLLSWAES